MMPLSRTRCDQTARPARRLFRLQLAAIIVMLAMVDRVAAQPGGAFPTLSVPTSPNLGRCEATPPPPGDPAQTGIWSYTWNFSARDSAHRASPEAKRTIVARFTDDDSLLVYVEFRHAYDGTQTLHESRVMIARDSTQQLFGLTGSRSIRVGPRMEDGTINDPTGMIPFPADAAIPATGAQIQNARAVAAWVWQHRCRTPKDEARHQTNRGVL